MALFSRRKEKQAPAARSSGDAESPDERALDALAELLRIWGGRPLPCDPREPDEIHQLFEGWALHALTATPPPGVGGEGGQRSWPALSAFFRGERDEESAAVESALSDLGELIWSFIDALGRSLEGARDSDDAIGGRLTRLKDAVSSGDVERLKQEASESIALIEEQLRERQERDRVEVDALASRLNEVTDELVGVRKKLEVDPLTGINNRAALDDHLNRVVSLARVLDQPATLFMIDVDHFKWVNDRFGHPAGDEILKQTASTLAAVFRRRGDFVARYGGDEFAAVILDDSLEVAESIAERLIFSVRDVQHIDADSGEEIRISASVGVARREASDDLAAWMAQADRALYQAKELGRDRFALATGSSPPPDSEAEADPEPTSEA